MLIPIGVIPNINVCCKKILKENNFGFILFINKIIIIFVLTDIIMEIKQNMERILVGIQQKMTIGKYKKHDVLKI